MKHLVALSLLWLPHLTGSPVDSNNDKPHGYAPYVWITVHTCNVQTGWCQGQSRSGFALTVDNFYNRTSDTCTHYCPGMIYAHWRPFRDDPTNDSSKPMPKVSMLGAYVKKLDRSSCLEVPGGFKCSDRIVANTPLNKISILLYGSPRNRDYYFGDDPMADCGTDPQCAAFKVLRRTLHAPAESRKWPETDDVLTLRNSPYACVLSYVGLGDAEALSACHAQLGDSCFVSQGNRFCVGYSRAPRVGITNADAAASAPIAICEVSSAASLKGRAPAYKPTPEEIRDFLTPSSCDATVLSVESAVYSADHLSVELDVPTFYTVAEVSHVIMKVSLDECLLPSTGPADRDFSAVVYTVAKTLSKVRVSTHSTGIMLDATDWGMTTCNRTKGRDALNFTRVAAELASALSREGVLKLFLRLPRSLRLLNDIAFSQLDAFDAFVTPPGLVDMSRNGHCQNMWVPRSGDDSSEGVVAYLLTLLRRGVRANKVIFTLSLTGGIMITPLEARDAQQNTLEITGELSLADMETNTVLKCEEDLNTKCCSWSGITVWARDVMVNVTVSSTSFETLKRFPELVAVAFGVNQFVVAPVDSDFRRGVRSNTPAILGGHHRVVKLGDIVTEIPESQYKDPASGSKNCLDPQYNIGLSNTIVCPGLIAAHGALGVFKEPYKELYSTSYDKIFIGNLYKLESCTPGEPNKKAKVSAEPPQVAININTLIPTTDSNHYMVGILDTERVVEYAPPVNKVCVSYNTGKNTHSMNVVSVDDGYAVDKPMVEVEHGVIVKPTEVLYMVSNFTPGIDYINLNVSCVNYDVSALRPCLIAICGGDNSCRKDYGRLCNSAHEIVNDARRAGELMREGLEALAVQEKKSKMYQLPDGMPSLELEKTAADGGGRGARRKRFLGTVMGAAALGLAWHVSRRVDALEEQMDLHKNSYVSVSNRMVEVSNKLNTNIALINSRIDEEEEKMQKNNEIINSNFAMMRDAMMRNTEAALRDTNVKFSVLTSYQMWYAQMQSITHQMMQAAMYTKFMARGVENCLRQIASKRSGSCPSGLAVMEEHPGLTDFPTIGTALYKDRKIFIVHSVPGNVEKTVVRGVIPMPKMSTDGVPCWPDYKVWLIDGRYYQPSDCYGKYCHKPEPHERYRRCLANPSECKTVCTPCHRGICYRDKKFTWMEGSVAVDIESPPLEPFSRPHISDGPVSFSDLLKGGLSETPEMKLLQAINTSVKLIHVQEDLDNITRSLKEFDKRYDEITARRSTFAGWLSGFASDAALWTSIALLTGWCFALSAGIGYMFFFGGGCGGGGVVHSRNTKGRYKIL
ncbi:hypothetical protein D9C73_010096 [Collichthys lucidus]|uniref:Uncharacterized protein n=1 Tax=Collichthys lucidus TaxID=240159 RepID=A0A4U5ULI2_COLLU|nr:hypothetical protein D9C73_010096 [Collichthys lucidus]